MVKAILFDVYNTLVKESKDVGMYYTEAIRAVYGLNVENIKLADYEGMTTQETITEILSRNGLGGKEINEKMPQFLEELPYSHYNVAGHDSAVLMAGAQDVLKSFSTDDNYAVGIATGMLERIVRNMFERAGLNLDNLIKFGCYGNAGRDFSGILEHAVNQAMVAGAQSGQILLVSSSASALRAAKSRSVWAVGVATGKYSASELQAAGADMVAKNLKEVQKAAKSY